MSVFHVFKIAQMVPNRVKHHVFGFNLFLANVPVLYSLKTTENLQPHTWNKEENWYEMC